MLTGTLCCVVLFLWEVEPADAGVSQAPRHEVTEVGQSVTLRCQPISGHESLYWYRQTLGQGLEFLVYFRNGDAIDESGMPKDRFSAKMLNTSFSTLKIQPTGPRDQPPTSVPAVLAQRCRVTSCLCRKPLLPLLAPVPTILSQNLICSSITKRKWSWGLARTNGDTQKILCRK
uniref:Immunoglobulin V-set domain-containing protein n=1 Tax=Sus scrofa TaxID=9823 RepID=A0A4X1V2X1_PIG